MDLLSDLGGDLVAGLAYSALGLVLLVLGYVVVDRLTPGELTTLIYRERNRNAAVLVVSGVIALAAIIGVAIIASYDSLGRGLAYTACFGLVGIALLALAFVVIDRFTPGELGAICCDPDPHPAVWVTAAVHLAIGAIVAAAIS